MKASRVDADAVLQKNMMQSSTFAGLDKLASGHVQIHSVTLLSHPWPCCSLSNIAK